jgi:hypothetical protein
VLGFVPRAVPVGTADFAGVFECLVPVAVPRDNWGKRKPIVRWVGQLKRASLRDLDTLSTGRRKRPPVENFLNQLPSGRDELREITVTVHWVWCAKSGSRRTITAEVNAFKKMDRNP